MSKMTTETLRASVERRMMAAAAEIVLLFERTFAQYDEELSRARDANERQRRLLNTVFFPQVRLRRADVQQLLVSKEEASPWQQKLNSSLDQGGTVPPHVKEEQEELWTTQAGEQPQWLEEAQENREAEPQTSDSNQHLETEADDCGGSDPASSSGCRRLYGSKIDDDMSDSPEAQPDGDDDWMKPMNNRYNIVEKAMDSVHNPRDALPIFAHDQQSSLRSTSGFVHSGGKMEQAQQASAATVRIKNKYDVGSTLKFQKTVGGSNEHCCVPLCASSSHYNSKLSFHRFPKNPELRAQWLHKVRRTGFSVTQHTAVCSRHFEDVQIRVTAQGKRFLAANAVPSLFEWNNYTNDKTSPEPGPGLLEAEEEIVEPDPDVPMLMDYDYGPGRTVCTDREQYGKLIMNEAGCRTETTRPITDIGSTSHGLCAVSISCFDKMSDCPEPETDNSGEDLKTRDALNADEVCDGETCQTLKQCSATKCCHIKEEPEEFWTSQEGEQLQGLEEADFRKFLFSPLAVVSEDGGEKPQSSQLQQHRTQGNRGAEPQTTDSAQHVLTEDGSEPASNFDPHNPLQPRDDNMYDDDWTKPSNSQSGSNNKDVPKNFKGCDMGEKSITYFDRQSESPKPETFGMSEDSKTGEYLNAHEVSKGDATCHTDKKQFSCTKCRLTFACTQSLKTHKKTHIKRIPVSCPVCNKSFTHRPNLVQHMRTHTGEKPFSCSYCNKSFTQRSSLVQHIRQHTGEKPFSCSFCNKSFTHRPNLVQHTRTHTGEKPFSCSFCNKSFTHRPNLVQHIRTHTGEKPFSCSACDKRFTQRSSLVQHMRKHSGEKPFSCSTCDKSFTQCSALFVHMRTHTGEKPFSCSACDKSFSQCYSLVGHMRTHTGERPFPCSVCGRSFTRRSHLVNHMRAHAGDKTFSCSVCGKECTHRSALVQHMRTHTGEKPFSCSACNKSFSHRASVVRHMREKCFSYSAAGVIPV